MIDMKSVAKPELFRALPQVDEVVRYPPLPPLIAAHGQSAITEAARLVLSRIRNEISSGLLDRAALHLALEDLSGAIQKQVVRSLSYSLRSVINATGVILHTNLGRAPLAQAALSHLAETAVGYSNLEFDVEAGERGKRDVHVDRLFRKLLADLNAGSLPMSRDPAQAISTIVVNNNAAAVLLALNTLADGGEVIVSRGELVEIGGSFRIPDVMAKSGAILREVGTTNRTRTTDYERAINDRTKLLLRVHRSHFEITGFTEQPDIRELVELSEKHKLPLVEDLGSGALFDLRTIGINNEPSVIDSLRAGVHVVTYSGDKLLGGPQAGLISGSENLVQKMRGNSLFRALRVDKLTYAALEATLLTYVKRDHGAIPALRMMQLSKAELSRRAENLVSQINSSEIKANLVDGESLIGGGSAPSSVLPTRLIAITAKNFSANEL